jgi:hypothetical protein
VTGVAVTLSAGERLELSAASGDLIGVISAPAGSPAAMFREDDHAISAVGPLSWLELHGRVHIAWAPVEGALHYRVLSGGREVAIVEEVSTGLPTSTFLKSEHVVVQAWGNVSIGHEIVEGILGTMVLLPRQEALNSSDVGDAGRNDLQDEGVVLANPTRTIIRHSTFIPDAWVSAPLLCGGSWPFPGDRYFRGDNRSWSATSSAYRTRADVDIRWTGSNSVNRSVGATRLYRRNANGTYTFLESKIAPLSGISGYFIPQGSNGWWFRVDHSVGNPFCSGVGVMDAQFRGIVFRTSGFSNFILEGVHDRAPNYEFYYWDSVGGAYHRAYGWSRGSFVCLDACTQHSYSVVR